MHPAEQSVPAIGWSADPTVVLGIALLAALYAFRAGRLDVADPAAAPSFVRRLLFAGGLLTLIVALMSPLHDLSDHYLFAAHMVQHLLMILVLPPLLLAGLSADMVRPLLRPPVAMTIARALTRPVPAFLLCNALFALSHVPSIYNFILENHGSHTLEHLAFMATAILLWWPILGPVPELPRLSYPLQMLYLFLQTLPGPAVGGFIANADRPLYALYERAPRIWPISPLADQQAGALIMWVGGSFFFLIALTAVFFVWATSEERRDQVERARRLASGARG